MFRPWLPQGGVLLHSQSLVQGRTALLFRYAFGEVRNQSTVRVSRTALFTTCRRQRSPAHVAELLAQREVRAAALNWSCIVLYSECDQVRRAAALLDRKLVCKLSPTCTECGMSDRFRTKLTSE